MLATSVFLLPTSSAFAIKGPICQASSIDKRHCNERGGKWNKLTCDCVVGGSVSLSVSTGTPGAGNPEEPGNPGAPGGNPGGTEQGGTGAGNPGNGKSVGNAGEKDKDNEPDNSGTSGSGNDPGKGGKGKDKDKNKD